eukprot:02388_4
MELLERLGASFEKCQLALTEYLKSKRSNFPRFYFVSDADVIDMMSKGSIPKEVQHHIPKIFPQVLQLELDGDDFTTNVRGLVSREGERLIFPDLFSCEGGVENWMNSLHRTISNTLKGKLADAIASIPKDGE